MWNESSRERFNLFTLSLVLLVALSGTGYGQDPSGRPTDPKGKKPPVTPPKRPGTAPPETRTPTVILTVLTDPPGTSVFLNGEARGATNAEGKMVLDRLALGHYTVEVRKEGFNSMVRGFQAGADSPTLVFKLDPKFEDFSKDFDSLVAAGKLAGPETPNAFELVGKLMTKYPERPEVARMRGVLSGKLIERIGPVLDRTISNWKDVTRDELLGARESASTALILKSEDNRLQAQAAYLRAVISLRDWQTGSPAQGEGGAEGAGNGEALSAARVELEKSVAFDDAWAAAWYQLGMVRLNGADLSGAETSFIKVSQLEPKWPIAHLGLGSTYYGWAKYKEAVDAYKKALDLDKQNVVALAGLGLARAARGDKDGVKDIKKAIEMDAASALPHLYLGMVYSKSKKKDELARAVEELKQAIQKNPHNLEFPNRVAEQLIAESQKPKK